MNFVKLLREPETEKTTVSDIPSSIMSDIISLLPTKSIMSCKLVSKFWCSLVRDLDFSKSCKYITMIVGRNVHNLLGNENLRLVQPNVDFSVKQINGKSRVTFGKKAVITLKDGRFDGVPFANLNIVNPCKGLLCLISNDWGPFFVCNPVMSDYVVLEQEVSKEMERSCKLSHAGFGYSSKSGKYKVVRFFEKQKDDNSAFYYEADVCTLGGDEKWRHLCTPKGYWVGKGVFLEGAIHWLHVHRVAGDSGIWKSGIVAFDCDEETFVNMHSPFEYNIALSVLQSRLCVCHLENGRYDYWVMDEYGIKESWRKLFVISAGESGIIRNFVASEALMYWNCEEVLLLNGQRELFSYNLTSNTSRSIKIPGITGAIDAMVFDPVFLPTKSLLMHGKQLVIQETE